MHMKARCIEVLTGCDGCILDAHLTVNLGAAEIHRTAERHLAHQQAAAPHRQPLRIERLASSDGRSTHVHLIVDTGIAQHDGAADLRASQEQAAAYVHRGAFDATVHDGIDQHQPPGDKAIGADEASGDRRSIKVQQTVKVGVPHHEIAGQPAILQADQGRLDVCAFEIERSVDVGVANDHRTRTAIGQIGLSQQRLQQSRANATTLTAPTCIVNIVDIQWRRVAPLAQVGRYVCLHLLPDPTLGGRRIVQFTRQRWCGRHQQERQQRHQQSHRIPHPTPDVLAPSVNPCPPARRCRCWRGRSQT